MLVIGDFMLDEYVHGTVERISPEAPVPVVVERSSNHVPGGAGNVVRNLRALGAQVSVAGTVGSDEAGLRLREMLTELGCDTAGLARLEGRPTTRKTRIIAARQQVCRLDREDLRPLETGDREALRASLRRQAGELSAVIISDYDKGVVIRELIEECVALARKHDFFLAVDPQVTHFEHYRGVGVLTPNHHEAGRYLGRRLDSDEEVARGGAEILDRLKAGQLLITRGEKGMTLFRSDRPGCEHFPTMAREVFDVTGAGDTVISVFTLAVAAGASLEEAVFLSNRAAGLVVAHVGAATVTTDDLLAVLP